MSLLPEFAILPDVFLKSGQDEASRLQLAYLRDAILRVAAVRNLRDGEWQKSLESDLGMMSKSAQELLKSLCKGSRLVPSVPELPTIPCSEAQWCDEALMSAKRHSLTAIISSPNLDKAHQQQSSVHPLDALSETKLGQMGIDSVQTPFRLAEYLKHIGSILSAARRICFIDPYIDPAHRDYREFLELLRHAGKRHPAPKLEIHRKCAYTNNRPLKDLNAWKTVFADWHQSLKNDGIAAEVFIWDDFKERYLISELVGLLVGKGFKTNNDPKAKNTWSRLSRENAQSVDREFDDNSHIHGQPYCRFIIGAGK